MQSFAREILYPEMSDQIFLFLVPSLATEIPLADLVTALLQPRSSRKEGSGATGSFQTEASPWLLYSILTFGERQLGSSYLYII